MTTDLIDSDTAADSPGLREAHAECLKRLKDGAVPIRTHVRQVIARLAARTVGAIVVLTMIAAAIHEIDESARTFFAESPERIIVKNVGISALGALLCTFFVHIVVADADRLEQATFRRLAAIVPGRHVFSARYLGVTRFGVVTLCLTATILLGILVARHGNPAELATAVHWQGEHWWRATWICAACCVGVSLTVVASKQAGAAMTEVTVVGDPPVIGFTDLASLPTPSAPHEHRLRVAHWSDLHLTAGPTVTRVEDGSPGGNVALERLLAKFGPELASSKTDVVLVTGDVTDTGLAQEWHAFIDLVTAADPSLLDKLVVIPGNHDLNITSGEDFFYSVETEDLIGRNLRLIHLMSVLDAIQGSRAKVLFGGKLVTLREYIKINNEVLHAYLRNPHNREVRTPEQVWRRMFPLVFEFDNHNVALMAFDSSSRSSYWITNAFGYVPRAALERAHIIRSEFYQSDEWAHIYALHHHVVMPKVDVDVVEKLKARGMVIENARDLHVFLSDGPPTVVFHGHRHIERAVIAGDISIVSARSTTLGDEAPETSKPDAAGKMPGVPTTPRVSTPGFRVIDLVRRGRSARVASVAAFDDGGEEQS